MDFTSCSSRQHDVELLRSTASLILLFFAAWSFSGKLQGGSGWGTHVNPWLIHVNV